MSKIYFRAHVKMKCANRTLPKNQPKFANGYPVTKKTLKISNWLFCQFMHVKERCYIRFSAFRMNQVQSRLPKKMKVEGP